MIALVRFDLKPEGRTKVRTGRHYIIERFGPVNFRLALPKQIQIWTIEKEYLFHKPTIGHTLPLGKPLHGAAA